MERHFHIEKPSDQDLFHGKSHDRVAEVIADTIQNSSSVRLIGIEGQLGAGKSTVINLTKSKLPRDEYHFIDYDAELHHHGESKKSLITVLHDSLLDLVGAESKQRLTEYRDTALGNTLSYTKKQKSKLSWWTVTFIVSVLFSSQVMKPLLSGLGSGGGSSSTDIVATSVFIFQVILFLSPVLMLICFKMFGKGADQTISDMVKRNSDDTIHEKILVSREVGIIELHNALTGFLDCLPRDRKVILVFDNLDRVPAEKVKEVWSDIELISSLSNDNFKVLLPYSEKHVAAALSEGGEDDFEGLEFIAKRIPVSYRVPPIVSAGWREAFSTFWQEAFGNERPEEEKRTAELLEIWLPQTHSHITPRLLKRLINDIQALVQVVPVPVSYAAVAYYILTTRYAGLSVENLLEDSADGELDVEIAKRISSSRAKLNRLFIADKDEWQKQILCTHYQTNSEIAECELIENPLREALNTQNGNSYISLSKLYGFSTIESRLIEEGGYAYWAKLTVELLDQGEKDAAQALVRSVNVLLNTEFGVNGQEEYEEESIASLAAIVKADVGLDEGPLYRQFEYLESELAKVNSNVRLPLDEPSSNNSDPDVEELLEELDYFSEMLGKNALENTSVSGGLFMKYLSGNEKKYEYLDISSIRLGGTNLVVAYDFAFKRSKISWLSSIVELCGMTRLGNTPLNREIKEGRFDDANSVNTFLNGNSVYPITEKNTWVLASLPFQSRWHTELLVDPYLRNITNSDGYEDELKAQALVQLIASNNFRSFDRLKSVLSNSSDIKNNLIELLPLVSGSTNIYNAFKDEEIAGLISESFCEVIEQDRIQTIEANGLVKGAYDFVREYLEYRHLNLWLSNFAPAIEDAVQKADLESIGGYFIEDVLDSSLELPSTVSALCYKVGSFDGDLKDWERLITSPSANEKRILTYMESQGIELEGCRGAADALINIYEENTKYLDEGKIEVAPLCLQLLPSNEKKRVKGVLNDLVHQRDRISTNQQIAIIRDFSQSIKLDMSSLSQSKRAIVRLFEAAPSWSFMPQWLAHQEIDFSEWSAEDLESVALTIKGAEQGVFEEFEVDSTIKPYLVDAQDEQIEDEELE